MHAHDHKASTTLQVTPELEVGSIPNPPPSNWDSLITLPLLVGALWKNQQSGPEEIDFVSMTSNHLRHEAISRSAQLRRDVEQALIERLGAILPTEVFEQCKQDDVPFIALLTIIDWGRTSKIDQGKDPSQWKLHPLEVAALEKLGVLSKRSDCTMLSCISGLFAKSSFLEIGQAHRSKVHVDCETHPLAFQYFKDGRVVRELHELSSAARKLRYSKVGELMPVSWLISGTGLKFIDSYAKVGKSHLDWRAQILSVGAADEIRVAHYTQLIAGAFAPETITELPDLLLGINERANYFRAFEKFVRNAACSSLFENAQHRNQQRLAGHGAQITEQQFRISDQANVAADVAEIARSLHGPEQFVIDQSRPNVAACALLLAVMSSYADSLVENRIVTLASTAQFLSHFEYHHRALNYLDRAQWYELTNWIRGFAGLFVAARDNIDIAAR